MHRIALRGDTMVEVLIAITVYSVVSIFTMATMKIGMQEGEASLEQAQTRSEISAQADALRFIHNSYLSEVEHEIEGAGTYAVLWNEITAKAVSAETSFPQLAVSSCSTHYDDSGSLNSKKFIINTRRLDPYNVSETIVSGSDKLIETTLYPRVVYGNGIDGNSDSDLYDDGIYDKIFKAEGIWVAARQSEAYALGTASGRGIPQYYDFHIYTCWNTPGNNTASTLGTIIRLYNPLPRETR